MGQGSPWPTWTWGACLRFFPGQLAIPHDPQTLEELFVRLFPGQLATLHDPHTLEQLIVSFFPGQLAIPPWPTCTWEAWNWFLPGWLACGWNWLGRKSMMWANLDRIKLARSGFLVSFIKWYDKFLHSDLVGCCCPGRFERTSKLNI